tara:strand:+ start:372 stop:932 length:561 start_codon:yes stop_codon:yes gene_type:complete
MDQREFVSSFTEKGVEAYNKKEPFESYIYLWLAFLQSSAPEEIERIKSDRNDIVKPWNKKNYKEVYELVKMNQDLRDNFRWLSKRYDGSILNPDGQDDRDLNRMKLLSSSIRGSYDIFHRPLDVSYALLNLCLSVRNNLFHGGKKFYDKNDYELLNNLCPILFSLIKINYPSLKINWKIFDLTKST